MGGTWVETASLKALGVLDRDLELDKDYCNKYENGTGVYDPNGIEQRTFTWRGSHFLETQFTGWDSYYTLCVFSLIVGTIWYLLFFKKIKQLQDTPVEEFRLKKKNDALLDEKTCNDSVPEKTKWFIENE
jgi:hypothetical protein